MIKAYKCNWVYFGIFDHSITKLDNGANILARVYFSSLYNRVVIIVDREEITKFI
jgi:hypothetical protein